MVDSVPSVKMDNHSDQEDPLIEIPTLAGNELVKKSQLTMMDIRGLVVRCTSCLHQINHHDPDKVKKHRRLGVIICSECYDFYGTSEFSQDESGNYNYCTWCGNGGKLFLCDFCPNTFCSTCVRRNIGRAAVSEMNKEGWKCYCCDSSKLQHKVAFCNLIVHYSKKSQRKREKKASSAVEINTNGIKTWPDALNFMSSAFESVDDSCKSFHRRVDKLKNIGMSQSKSLKHIIAKFEEIVNSHRGELNHQIKSLSRQYILYIETQKKLNKSGEKPTESKDDSAAEEEKKPDENGEKKLESTENCVANKSDDVEMENLDEPKEEAKPDDMETNINEDNYKAKLSLLNQDESSLSEIDNILAEDSALLDNSDAEDSKEKAKEEIEGKPIESTSNDKNANEDDKETKAVSKDSDSDIAELFSSKSNKKARKTVAKRKLNFDSPPSSSSHAGDSGSSIYLSSDGELKSKPSKKEKKKSVRKSRTEKIVTTDDPKLKLRTSVVLTRCDDLLPNGETTIPLPTSYVLEDLDKEIKSLIKEPVRREKTSDTEKKKSKKVVKENKPKVTKVKYSGSSSSICLSTSEEEETTKKKLFKASGEDPNARAKKEILSLADDDSSSFSDSSNEESDEQKKKKSKKGKANSGSSDEFQPKKKKKFDKLLNKRILSDEDSDFKDDKKNGERKKRSKRKREGSDDSKSELKKQNSDETTSSDSDEEKKDKKKKKRKRIKKPAASSSSDEDKKKEGDKDEEGGSQNTPGKGRKNIKKILSKKNLAVETKEAQALERDRRRRVMERQKMYNVITEKVNDGTEVITRKMVLEIDPVSKEEIVQIHPDIVEKLKPHQVNGVKFMWECTIESLKQLEETEGSGCILAHCMGLGKTLQVIAFLHTCLTNEHVNKHIKTAMVICPYNTVLNWSKELDYWLQEVDGNILVHELTLAKDTYTRVDVLEYWQRDGGILIISYDLFRRLAVAKIKGLKAKSKTAIFKSLIDPGADIVICDEGHVLKNVNSAISKACATIRTERRIVLTGTPLQNNLQEYHCMLSFVKPHLLGTPKEFRNRFVNPIMNGQYEDSTEYDVKRMKKRIHILHKLLEGCVQRCDYSALTKFLPPKHEFVISVKLSEIQIKMYRWYLDNMSRSRTELKIRGGTLFTDYNILRNLCTHPFIIQTSHERAEKRRILKFDGEEEEETFINDDSEESMAEKSGTSNDEEEVVRKYKTRSRQNGSGDEIQEEPLEEIKEKAWFNDFISEEDKHKIELSGKMILLVDILKECEAIGDKVIVFSQSLLTFDLIEDLLYYLHDQPVSEDEKARDIKFTWQKNVDYFRMDGSTSAEFRKQYIDYFNDPVNDRARLFLVSTKAGGLGTNLVGANRVIMLDASWNPSHDVQAIFRVYRFGQKKPVYIYRFLAQGTMEEKIYDRQVTKLSLSIRVVDEQQIDRHFNAAELAELYQFEPESLPNRPTPMVPKDTLLAEMLIKHKDWIVTYHEHDSLLQNQTEEDLNEEERKAAWAEYENEREGRYASEETQLDETIKGFCREPDFNDASYEGTVIPSAKSMIEAIIAAFRKLYPLFSAADLRKKLHGAIFALRAMFQEKHVKILRMKQEYVAKGSVPVSVNKYLEELNHIVSDLTMHYENVSALVAKDYNAAKAQMAQKLANQYAAQNPQGAQYTAQNPVFLNRPFNLNMPNQQFNARMNAANFAQRFPQLNVRMNVGANFKPGDAHWNPQMSQNISEIYRRLTAQQQAQYRAAQAAASTASEPVITEVETNDPKISNNTASSNSHSTVEITEIE